jgi:hemoglobin
MRDIETLEDIRLLVDGFYGKVREDELLGPVFEEKLAGHWDRHLEKMYRFWQTVLLDEGQTYFGNPFMKHAPLPIYQPHFDRWLLLWDQTLNAHFQGPRAEDAINRARNMAYVFIAKLNAIRQEGGKPVF